MKSTNRSHAGSARPLRRSTRRRRRCPGKRASRLSAEAGFKLVAKGTASVSGELSGDRTSQKSAAFVDGHEHDLGWIADLVKASGRRVVIEDFHYLSADEQQAVAADLKALWDLKVFVLLVGVWSEQNLLTSYNG
ncbi:MAG TPA: hypothetical protein VM580_24680, partial [Labilithrix sp.]|nr:hypothetical protein [Labilithrix sp.]